MYLEVQQVPRRDGQVLGTYFAGATPPRLTTLGLGAAEGKDLAKTEAVWWSRRHNFHDAGDAARVCESERSGSVFSMMCSR
jgi:hypothetical protein